MADHDRVQERDRRRRLAGQIGLLGLGPAVTVVVEDQQEGVLHLFRGQSGGEVQGLGHGEEVQPFWMTTGGTPPAGRGIPMAEW